MSRVFLFSLSALLFATSTLSAGLHVGERRPLGPRESPEPLRMVQAIATSGDVALAVWRDEGDGARAALFNARGDRLSVDDILIPGLTAVVGVAGRDGGFLVYGWLDSRLAAFAVSQGGVLDPTPIVVTDGFVVAPVIECAGLTCLAAWREQYQPGAVRIARMRGASVLDPGGVPVVFLGAVNFQQGFQLGIATDGIRFLLGWPRPHDGGTIVSAALIDPASAIEFKTFDVLAVPEVGTNVAIEWNGSAYHVYLSGAQEYPPHRFIRVRPEGSVIDGDASGWAGWRLEIPERWESPFTACGTSWILASSHVTGMPPYSAVYEVHERSSNLFARLPYALGGFGPIACFAGGRSCLALGSEEIEDHPRLTAFIVPLSCRRSRIVGR